MEGFLVTNKSKSFGKNDGKISKISDFSFFDFFQKRHPKIFCKWPRMFYGNPLEAPIPLVAPLLTKNLDTAGPWCVLLYPGKRCQKGDVEKRKKEK